MVERTEAQFNEFEGEVVDVQLEEPTKKGMSQQYHLQMKPSTKEIKGKTGLLHTWIRLTDTCTETSVPRGSVIDRYMEALEDIHGEDVKELKTIQEVFEFMKGKSYLFKTKVLGRAFQGHEPSEYWVPVKTV